MATERIRRRIEQLLDEADQAVVARNWGLARDRASDVLMFDPANADAMAYLAAAQRALGPLSLALSPFQGQSIGGSVVRPSPADLFRFWPLYGEPLLRRRRQKEGLLGPWYCPRP